MIRKILFIFILTFSTITLFADEPDIYIPHISILENDASLVQKDKLAAMNKIHIDGKIISAHIPEAKVISWFRNGEIIKKANKRKLMIHTAGVYSFIAYMPSGDKVKSQDLEIKENYLIDHYFDHVIISPNPIKGILKINMPNNNEGSFIAIIYNLVGDKLDELEIQKQGEIDLSQLDKGYYFLKLIKQDNTLVRKVLKI